MHSPGNIFTSCRFVLLIILSAWILHEQALGSSSKETSSSYEGITLSNRITLLNLADPNCDGPCRQVTGAMKKMRNMLESEHLDVGFITVLASFQSLNDATTEKYETLFHRKGDVWKFIRPEANKTLDIERSLMECTKQTASSRAMNTCIFIVDKNGNLLKAMPCYSDLEQEAIVKLIKLQLLK